MAISDFRKDEKYVLWLFFWFGMVPRDVLMMAL